MRRLAILTIFPLLIIGVYVRAYMHQATWPSDSSLAATAGRGSLKEVRSTAKRPVYPYSVISGGLASGEEAAARASEDAAVAAHYAPVRLDRLKPMVLTQTRLVYVSYRKNGRIYWTARPVALREGETVLTDGKEEIRARCGNRISEVAQLPVEPAKDAPAEAVMDTPETVAVPAAEQAPPAEMPLVAEAEEPVVLPMGARTLVTETLGNLEELRGPLPGIWIAGGGLPASLIAGLGSAPPQSISIPPTPDTPGGQPGPPVDLIPPTNIPPTGTNPPNLEPPGLEPPPSGVPPGATPPSGPPPGGNPPGPPNEPPPSEPPVITTPPGPPGPPPPTVTPSCLTCEPFTPPITQVPEPGTWILVALGIGAAYRYSVLRG